MNCDRRFLHHVLAGAAIGAMVLANPVRAADLPLKAPQFRPAFDWSGFYSADIPATAAVHRARY